MKPAFKDIIAAAVLILSVAAPVVAGPPDEDAILSKPDARAMFAFSRPQWEANVAAVVTAGLGRASGSPRTGIGLSIETPEGAVQTLPVYVGSDAKPTKLQVTVEYRLPAGQLNDAGVQASIAKAKQEMLPEYIVSGDFKRAAGGIAIFFTILEAR
jgi:hypothetical protein